MLQKTVALQWLWTSHSSREVKDQGPGRKARGWVLRRCNWTRDITSSSILKHLCRTIISACFEDDLAMSTTSSHHNISPSRRGCHSSPSRPQNPLWPCSPSSRSAYTDRSYRKYWTGQRKAIGS